MKKILCLILTVIMMISVTGCAVGTSSGSESDDYADLFPDSAAKDGKVYAHSQKGYKFSLDGYGEMLVYVDTSNGHDFELDADNSGFNIVDKDGNYVLRSAAVNDEAYAEMTAPIDDIITVNGRKFFYRENGDGSRDIFTYLADVGIDVGYVLEVEGDTDAFSLVAFRGNALEGSSSDPLAYKGTLDESAYIEDEVEYVDDEIEEVEDVDDEEVDLDVNPSSKASSLANNTLDSEVYNALEQLDTDFWKINWGVLYSLSEDLPFFVISVTPFYENDEYNLLVGLTNLYDEDMDFTATASAYDADGNYIGEEFVYETAIGVANTATFVIHCGDSIPDGRIHWEEAQISTSETSKYIAWEADYNVSGKASSGYFDFTYELYSANNEDMEDVTLAIYLLDEEGYVIATGYDFVLDPIPAGEKYSGETSIYGDSNILQYASGIAMFANPTVNK